MTVLLTGASGFVGGGVLRRLQEGGFSVRPVVRTRTGSRRVVSSETVFVRDLDVDVDWSTALAGVRVVVHCAARAHVMNERCPDPLAAFRAVNVDGTLHLARQAAAVGVKRFVFISSIGVNGGRTFGKPFRADDVAAPQDAYARSKWEAEQALKVLAEHTGMELVIIRPPLVYGPGAPGNFGSLMAAIERRVLLPLGAVHNRRTLVALENLVDLIAICVVHPQAAGEIFLAGDAEDISTTELLRRLGLLMGKPTRLLPVPVPLMVAAAALVGRAGVVRKVCGDLQVDISKARELLGWAPPLGLDEGLRRAVRRVG